MRISLYLPCLGFVRLLESMNICCHFYITFNHYLAIASTLSHPLSLNLHVYSNTVSSFLPCLSLASYLLFFHLSKLQDLFLLTQLPRSLIHWLCPVQSSTCPVSFYFHLLYFLIGSFSNLSLLIVFQFPDETFKLIFYFLKISIVNLKLIKCIC